MYRVALDAQSGTVRLRHAPITVNAGAAYLAPPDELPADHVDEVVETRTLDEIAGDDRCDCIKLDAEGAEPRILRGAARTLARWKPIVLAELNPVLLERVGGHRASEVIAYMAAHGYVAAVSSRRRR